MYMDFLFSDTYKNDGYRSLLLLKEICKNKGVCFVGIGQVCEALGIKIINNNDEIVVEIPNHVYENCHLAIGHLQQEICDTITKSQHLELERQPEIFEVSKKLMRLNDHKQTDQHKDNFRYQKQFNGCVTSNKSVFDYVANNDDEKLKQDREIFTYTLTSKHNPNVYSRQVILSPHLGRGEKDVLYLKAIANRTLNADLPKIFFIEQYLQKNITQDHQDKINNIIVSIYYLDNSPKAYLVVCTQDQEILAETKQILEPLGFLVSTR